MYVLKAPLVQTTQPLNFLYDEIRDVPGVDFASTPLRVLWQSLDR